MKDVYVFDYNIVVKLDPSYRQYLTEERPQEKNIIEIMTAPVAPAVQVTLRERTPDGASLTDADMSVINEVSATNVRPPKPVNSSGRHLPRERDEAKISSPKSRAPTLYLKPEFSNSKLNGRKICSPRFQLRPPKIVLSPGSVMYEDKKIWTIASTGHDFNQDAVLLNKSSISISGDKIRFVSSAYWFDRVKNVTSERSANTKILVYNKKTKQLYKLYKVKVTSPGTRRRYKYIINGVLMNYQLCTTHLVITNYIADKFVKEIEKVVRRDVPDAYTPPLDPKLPCFAYTLEMLILQHKLGKRVDWINKDLYMRVSEILHYTFGHNAGYEAPHEESIKSHKKKISKFIPHLRKYTNYTALMEGAFGHLYHKLLLKILPFNLDMGSFELIAYSLKNNFMSKPVRHLLHAVLNSMLDRDSKRRALIGIYSVLYNMDNHDTSITETWVTIALRFVKNSVEPPSNYIWKDMYEMAARYHVRIRPRKFNDMEDIQILHDKLVAIQNRDRDIARKYRDRVFLHFDHPDKLYDGFQFTFLGTPAALREEGVLMHHCVGGYAHRCISGHSIIFSMKNDDVRYITVELDGKTYKVRQKYTINDNLVSNDTICNIIEAWEKDIVKMHKDDEESYYDLCNPSNKPITIDISVVEINNDNWLLPAMPNVVAF